MIKKTDAFILTITAVILVVFSFVLVGKNNTNGETTSMNSIVIDQYPSSFFNAQWIKLSSGDLGITFEYPLNGSGTIDFKYENWRDFDRGNSKDPNGMSYGWELLDQDEWNYRIAGGVSKDYIVGRESWFTDFYQLNKDNYEFSLLDLKTKYSTDAYVFKADHALLADYPEAMVIKINLPDDFNQDFKGLAIYSKNGFTNDEIRRIVDSLELRYRDLK